MSSSITPGKEERFTVNRGRLDSINIYDVTEQELEKLATGGSDSIFLNFAIFTLSVAISFFITLLTTKIETDRVYITFLVITSICFLSGIILLLIWWKSRYSIKDLINKIRERIPPREEQ